MLRQRKVPKRNAGPAACPLRGFPALLVKTGARATRDLANARFAQTGRERHPVFTAMLGCANGIKVKTKDTNQKTATPNPSALTEYRRQSGTRRAPCLRQACLPSCARPRIGEERRASASADECSGCPSLWVLSLGQARESISPRRAKPAVKKCEQIKRLPPTAANPNNPSKTHPPPGHIVAPRESPRQPATDRDAYHRR